MTSSQAEAHRALPSSGQECVLATGFEAFGDHQRNPSWDSLIALDWPESGPFRLERQRLPVDYQAVAAELPRLYASLRPAAVVHFGVMSERARLRLETRAHRKLGQTPDNRGFVPPSQDAGELLAGIDQQQAKDWRAQTLNLDLIRDALRRRSVPFRDSDDAGGYLCNFTLYLSLGLATSDPPRGGVGFIHVPPLDEQLNATQLSEAMRAILEAIGAALQESKAPPSL